MEERIIEDEGRSIKVKRNALGGIEDATDGTAPSGDAAEERADAADDVEIDVDFPEEEYDESLVGLTPSQLDDYDAAERFFSQALMYDGESVPAQKGVWESRTQGFTDDAPFFIPENAEKLAEAPEEVRSYVLGRVEDRLRGAREGVLEELRPLRAAVRDAREARRGALWDNKHYYLVRTAVSGGAFVLFLVLMGIFSAFLLRTRGSWPVIGMAVCGAIALIALVFLIVFLRGLVFALRLCADNEKDESTEDGRRLAVLERELACLDLVLGDKGPDPDEES